MVELDGLHVVVDRVVYQPDMATPEDRPHCFAYFITIRNDSDSTVTIKGRKWVVHEADGNKTVVEGDGVVGMFPELAPASRSTTTAFTCSPATGQWRPAVISAWIRTAGA